MEEWLSEHFEDVLDAMATGNVVPLLGAGANLCDREEGDRWVRGGNLPSGSELACYLADKLHYPDERSQDDLVRVSQYGQSKRGSGTLFRYLHEVFSDTYEPTALHHLLATMPKRIANARGTRKHQLIVTTNYDDALEQAFDRAGETYDVVWYEGPRRGSPAPGGRCMHRTPDGEVHEVVRANEYAAISLEERPVILKVHGAVDRREPTYENDSYVISEDHYIEYLSDTCLTDLFPVTLLETLFTSHFLFLGYRLRDWNVRVILHQIWREREHELDAWAIQRDVGEIDRVLWDKRGVHLLDIPLDDYVAGLAEHLPLPAEPAKPEAAA
jgi:hypothetical protein